MQLRRYGVTSFPVRSLVLASVGVILVSCAPIEQQVSRKPLMGMPTIAGLEQVRDRATGSEYFAPCSPCAAPTPKTLVQESGPVQEVAGAIAAAVRTAIASPSKRPEAQPAQNPAPVEAARAIKRVVHFSSANSKPNPAELRVLLDALPLAKNAQLIEVRGFADSTGTAALNERLSLARAKAVAHRLIASGIPKSKVEITHCATCYAAPNDTEAGRQANRRVEVEFVMRKAIGVGAAPLKRG